ncbi:MAG TPA: hypothetical protein DCY52_10325 [Methylococcaceae bacterium]|jgi:hypothetical protein|nr:hypothetical protein [Methylococcaceae bacterium]
MRRDSEELLMLPKEKTDPQENPLCCALIYRRAADEDFVQGDGIGWSTRIIRFQGIKSLVAGDAAEVRLEAVKGLFPPLMVLTEVSACQAIMGGRFEITGQIKGILTL